MRFLISVGAVLLPFASIVRGIAFNPDDEASIRKVSADYAYNLMTYYKNNASGTATTDVGTFAKPLYWWEAGAAWGGLIEYTQFTDDQSYVDTLTQALVANYGPNNDILLSWRESEEGNDDQAFWGFTIMSALEYQFPDPAQAPATYLQVVENCFNNIISRWNTTTCAGGLKWQIYPANAYGYSYKNSISNGATFALGARLAAYTGNQTYADWATKLFNWSFDVGLISNQYEVFDGTSEDQNCTQHDPTQWTYNVGVYLHGAAVMYNYTNGDATWKKHTTGFFDHTSFFFKPYDNATDIMYEKACETGTTGRVCNLDQQSFKAYLSRFIAKTAILAPFTREQATTYLQTSAIAAAKSCSGPSNACGSKWYTGGWDGTSGVGQQLSALEVTQALLMLKKNLAPSTQGSANPSPSSTVTSILSSSTVSSSGTLVGSLTTAISSNGTATAGASETSGSNGSFHKASTSQSDVPSTGVPGVFAPALSRTSDCSPSVTVTVYVPPASSVEPNGTAAVSSYPSATTTGPAQFTGAASAVTVMTGNSVLAAAAIAMIGVLL